MDKNKTTPQMARYFLRSYPWQSLLMVLCLLLAGLFEGTSIAFFLPLIGLAAEGGSENMSGIEEAMVGFLDTLGLEPTLPLLLGIIVAGLSMKGLLLWLAMRQVGYTIAAVAQHLRMQLISALLHARWSYFSSRPVGVFANAVGTEALLASQAYQNIALAIACLIQVLVYVVVGLLISWQATALAVLAGLLVVVLLRGFVKISKKAGQSGTRLIKALTTRLVDGMNGIKPIKAMAREESLLPFLAAEVRGIHEAQRSKIFAHHAMVSFQEPITVFVLALGLYYFIEFMKVPFVSLLILAFLFSRIVNQINPLLRYLQAMVVAESAFWSLRDEIHKAESAREEMSGSIAVTGLREEIRFRDVEFDYEGTEVLRGVTFTVAAGEFAAIAGLSGAGKTTIADLMLGLQSPRRGAITVDGVDLTRIDMRSWRSLVGYVPQEMFLFHDTIRHNVTLGDDAISEADIERALKDAEVWDFVSGLAEGVDTVVGEKGTRLSGGQRQRVAIARALARRPVLLILDEVTTALDPATERSICRTLARLRGRVTIVSISHQPALRDIADVIFELAEGGLQSVVGRGGRGRSS